ncbi:MAG: hypothetical protein WAN36_01320 [Calditrichia bacterium]
MFNKATKLILPFLLLTAAIFIALNCNTGIESSPSPGILRVTLQADPADTSIVVVSDTLQVHDNDDFSAEIYQGKVFRDSTYAILYPSLESWQQKDSTYNIILREGGEYRKFTIFESHVPPGNYNRIRFGIEGRSIKIRNFDKITVETPPNYYVDIPVNFEIRENQVTEVNVQVSPFKYATRFRDIWLFTPEMEVAGVNYIK